jgi:nicotinate-nucleotide adenylyltransferase
VRLGILGGTFDPIHNGHLDLARSAQRALKLDKVLFVPAGQPPHKRDVAVTPSPHRSKMVELAIAGQPCFAVSRVDLDRSGPHYTVDTVTRLKAEYNLGAETCFFIIGSDSLEALPTWHAPEKLLKLCRIAVGHRPGYRPDLADLTSLLPDLPERITWVEMPANPISATVLRQRIACGEDITGSIPSAVLAYIRQTGLYKSEAP